jgi:hypothetical protein
MKITFSFLLALISLSVFSQNKYTPERLGWTPFQIKDKKLGTINYFVSSNEIKSKKPVLLYLDGSGNLPLYQIMQRGVGGTIALNVKELSKTYHIVVLSKPGIPFIDSVKMEDYNGVKIPSYKPKTDEYDKRLSLEWRAEAASAVINKIEKDLPINNSKIAVIGISEGFSVGAKLAAINKKVTHAALVVGHGLNQFFDFIIQARNEALTGKITLEQAQKRIDSLYTDFRAIYADKSSITKQWQGHTYLRWSSFCGSFPMDDVLKANIPTHVVACANDTNTAVLSTDYLYLESIRLGRTNIDYKVYPYDHFFNEPVKNEKGEVTGMTNHTLDVIGSAITWINNK